jgi:protein-tyrosine phosphatase
MIAVSVVLFLCRGNVCRSVMAQALLSARTAERGLPVTVASAGLLGGGQPPPPEVAEVMAARGLAVGAHRSRVVTADDLAAADLILGLARGHLRHAAVLLPDAWPRTFTIREFVRRGRLAGPRGPGEPLADWVNRVADGRGRLDVLGARAADDVADPTGGPSSGYQATAELLDRLTADLVGLGWPSHGTAAESPGSVRDKSF